MKYKVSDFAKKFSSIVGDSTYSVSDEFIINGLNWVFSELPMVPKLDRVFEKHYQHDIAVSKGHHKWKLNNDFRIITDVLMMNFWTSRGGDLCKLPLCHLDVLDFYNKHGIPSLKQSGEPCNYTLERDDEDLYLVFDRPTDVPVVVDYILTGVPKMITSMEDEIELTGIIENVAINTLRSLKYKEMDDMAFSGAIEDYLDNKQIPQIIQMINKRFGVGDHVILGGA